MSDNYMIDGQALTARVFRRRTHKPSRAPQGFYIDGVLQPKAVYFKRIAKRSPVYGAPLGHSSACWPMQSDALGINPDNIATARENLRKAGVPTEFTRDGQAILTSRGHRKQLAQLIGAHDRSPKASWGDP